MQTLLILGLALLFTIILVLANSLKKHYEKEATMANELGILAQQVQSNTDAENSAVQLLNSLHQLLSDALATQDIAKVEFITAQLKTSADALAASIVANTPSVAPAPVEPAPEEPAPSN